MQARYLTLALLASALWGVTYPLTYLALRLMNALELIMLSYVITVVILIPMVLFKGFDTKSLIKGLALSLINYPMVYMYTLISGDISGFAAFISTLYILPLMVIDYLRGGELNVQNLISSIIMLLGLYLLFEGAGGYGLLLPSLLLIILNLAYLMALSFFDDYDEVNVFFGQSLGTLVISIAVFRFLGVTMTINIDVIYYSLLLSVLSNVIPSLLYIVSIKRIGAVSTSLASSVEILSSLLLSEFMTPMPINPIALLLLLLSVFALILPPISLFNDGNPYLAVMYSDYSALPNYGSLGKISLPITNWGAGGSII